MTWQPIGCPLAQLELSDGLASLSNLRLLTGDGGDVANSTIHNLGVVSGITDAHIHHDLFKTGDEHRVTVAELLLHGSANLLAVLLLQTRHLVRDSVGAHLASSFLR